MLPNFIIAGATRSGTTSLYFYLNQHPEISFPTLKEPRYFSSIKLNLPQNGPGDHTVDEKLILTFNDYTNLYEGIENKIVGDASSEYLYHADYSSEEIKKVLGDIPILIILRNPVDRAYSAYNNLIRDGREKLSFEEALVAENERISLNWDMMWAYKSVGLYANQIEKYLQTFSKVKVIIFEDFVKETKKYLVDIYNFLGVDPDFKADTETKYSHSGKPKNKLFSVVTNRDNKIFYTFRKIFLRIFPRSFFEIIASVLLKKEDMKRETRLKLLEFYQDDITKLEKILNRNLDVWRI